MGVCRHRTGDESHLADDSPDLPARPGADPWHDRHRWGVAVVLSSRHLNPGRAARDSIAALATTTRELQTAGLCRQRVLATHLCSGQRTGHDRALCHRLSLHAKCLRDFSRYAAGCGGGRSVVGSCKIHFCLEPELLSLRRDLWIRWRRGRRAYLGLRFQPGAFVWRATDSSFSLRTYRSTRTRAHSRRWHRFGFLIVPEEVFPP